MLALALAALTAASPLSLDNGVDPLTLAISPDDQVLATGGEGGAVKLFSTANGKLLFELSLRQTSVLELAFSADGRYLAAGDLVGTIGIWTVKDGKPVTDFSAADTVARLAFSPDGKWLAVECMPDKNAVYSTKDWSRAAPLLAAPVAWSPDSKQVLGATDESLVWSDFAGRKLKEVPTPGRDSVVLATSDLKTVLARSGLHPAVQVIDAATGKMLGALEGHTKGVVRFAVSKDGKRAVTSSEDRTTRLWDLPKRKPLAKYDNVNGTAFATISPSGKWVAASDKKQIHLWKVK